MKHPLVDLVERSGKPTRTIVGLMSGTSADSIDVAICRLRGDGSDVAVELLHYREHAQDPEVRRQVMSPGGLDVRALAELNVRIGEAFASACLASLAQSGVPLEEVDLIGSHGQTVYHHSGVAGAPRTTFQLGDGDVIAVRTDRYVISDFRARDIAAGGEGAPLSPIADRVLFGRVAARDTEGRCAILNLGGIGNLTVLDADPTRTFGFDTGPANAPLDRLARHLTGRRHGHDADGAMARSGKVNERLLALLLDEDPHIHRPPPRSTGIEMYGDAFVDRAAAIHGGYDADLMATFVAFVAQTIAMGIQQCVRLGPPIGELIVAGGGVNNTYLLERIADVVEPVRLRRSDEVGVPSDAREAMAFAVLADMTLRGVPAWLPSVTGATAPKLLGKLSFP